MNHLTLTYLPVALYCGFLGKITFSQSIVLTWLRLKLLTKGRKAAITAFDSDTALVQDQGGLKGDTWIKIEDQGTFGGNAQSGSRI